MSGAITWVLQLFSRPKEDWEQLLPVLRAIIHSPQLAALVAASQNKADDLVLRVLKALVPPE